MNRQVYDHKRIEETWQCRWKENRAHQVELSEALKPYYNLMMFPYPSAEGLHVGNVYAFVGADIHGRFMSMKGYDVFEPMGFDAFGIHSENFAIQIGMHPKTLTAQSVTRFRETQLKKIGNRFDWAHEIQTTDPAYYKWTQWIFLQFFKAGLAERKKAAVNWCPGCMTVLADEQVIDGFCERSGDQVVQKELEQWFFMITKYAQKLLDNLDTLDWSEKVKVAQRNWIGRSEGVQFDLRLANKTDLSLEVFTTRPETIHGMTFIVVAPEHPLMDRLVTTNAYESVKKYCEFTRTRTEMDRLANGSERTGVFTGSYAINPANGDHVPVWIADYVLMSYGTGVIYGVPAHDDRDYAFAEKYGLRLQEVVCPGERFGHAPFEDIHLPLTKAYTDDGLMVNSGSWNGMTSMECRSEAVRWIEQIGIGHRVVKYHLRDWAISRQRYWGPPIPIIYCDTCGTVPVPEEDLPVLLPEIDDYFPTGTGSSPLANVENFVNVKCPNCDSAARRETDVSDNFLDSAWYFLRYPSSHQKDVPWDDLMIRKWLPVDMYIGGAEHSVLHLLYSRFLCMALYDLGVLPFDEPFRRFRAHGIITKNGAKMSKSKGNVVNPDHYITQYGADTLRLYLMFLGPFEQGGDFSDYGIKGISRFLNRVISLAHQVRHRVTVGTSANSISDARLRTMNRTIMRVSNDLEVLKYNTVISCLMEYVNALRVQAQVSQEEYEALVLMMAPLAPHIAEECWRIIGNSGSVHKHRWPTYDAVLAQPAILEIPIQVNGKTRDSIHVSVDTDETKVKTMALTSKKIRRYVQPEQVKRTIYVPGRILNIVI